MKIQSHWGDIALEVSCDPHNVLYGGHRGAYITLALEQLVRNAVNSWAIEAMATSLAGAIKFEIVV